MEGLFNLLDIIMNESRPLDHRTYRPKKVALHFYCPLCRTKRGIRLRAKLSKSNYIHIVVISAVLMSITLNIMNERVFIWPFIVWPVYETIFKMLWRKEVPCPHCGFDASWYKRDVKVARRLVEEFWKKKNPSSNKGKDQEDQEALKDRPSSSEVENLDETRPTASSEAP